MYITYLQIFACFGEGAFWERKYNSSRLALISNAFKKQLHATCLGILGASQHLLQRLPLAPGGAGLQDVPKVVTFETLRKSWLGTYSDVGRASEHSEHEWLGNTSVANTCVLHVRYTCGMWPARTEVPAQQRHAPVETQNNSTLFKNLPQNSEISTTNSWKVIEIIELNPVYILVAISTRLHTFSHIPFRWIAEYHLCISSEAQKKNITLPYILFAIFLGEVVMDLHNKSISHFHNC